MIPYMLSEDQLREKLSRAFLLAFVVSREGFNGECPCEHLAPSDISANYQTVEECISHLHINEAFLKLQDLAVSQIISELSEESE